MTAMFEFRRLCNAHAQLHAPSPASPARYAPGKIHESKTYSTAFALDSYLPLYLYVNSAAVNEVTDSQTDRQTEYCRGLTSPSWS